MAWREDSEIWREGPDDTQDTRDMSDWERAAYAHAKGYALSRGDLLKLAGLGLGGALLGPVVGANAAVRPLSVQQTGTLTIGRKVKSYHLDPAKSPNEPSDFEVMFQVYDNLVYLDTKGTVFPGLATAWNFSRNGKVVTFKLRRGVKFHDGTLFDASAVKKWMDRWVDPATASVSASTVGPLIETKVIDQYTVALVFKEPFAPLLANLASGYGGIGSPAALAKNDGDLSRNPVGTGPYRFVSWTADDTITLRRNQDHTWFTPFFKKPNGPPIDTVEFRTIPDDATRAAALTTKEIDMIFGFLAVPTSQVASFARNRDLQITRSSSLGLMNLVLNSTRPPFRDVRSRMALSHAIDRKKLVALAFNGQAKPATSILASAFPQYDPTLASYYAYDPEKARALLKAAGQSRGFAFDYGLWDGSPDSLKRAAQLIQEDLSKIKVKMNIKAEPTNVIVQNFTPPSHDNAFPFFYTGADADILRNHYQPKTGFFAHFPRDTRLESLFKQQSITISQTKRRALFRQIQRHIAVKMYSLPILENFHLAVAEDHVRNLRLDSQGFIHLQELTRT